MVIRVRWASAEIRTARPAAPPGPLQEDATLCACVRVCIHTNTCMYRFMHSCISTPMLLYPLSLSLSL